MSNHNIYSRTYSRLNEGTRGGDYANAIQHYAPRRDWATTALYAVSAIAVVVVALVCYFD